MQVQRVGMHTVLTQILVVAPRRIRHRYEASQVHIFFTPWKIF